MKTKLTLLSSVVILFATAINPQTLTIPPVEQWNRYTVKDEEFSVALPTLPAMTTMKVFVRRVQKKRVERVLIVNASVDYQPNRAEQFRVKPAIVGDRVFVEADFFAEFLGVERPTFSIG